MGKFARLVQGLYDDGLKALSIFSPLLSIAFTIAKIFDAVPILRHVDYGWAFLPLTIWLLVAYVRRWSAFQDQIELPRASPLSLTAMSAWERASAPSAIARATGALTAPCVAMSVAGTPIASVFASLE